MRELVHHAWFLTGPTASGKSAVGVELARRLGAEIIAMDSMSLYRGMDVGTAKPSAEDRRAVPHHLLDVLKPDQEFSLAQYIAAAEQAFQEIRRRGRHVLFVGGTPLYLKGLLRGVFEGPPADWELRRRLRHEAEQHGPGYLHAKLAAVDPASAGRLHARDSRRLIRALEVFEKTGQPISDWQRQFDVPVSREACRVFVLDWPREVLYERINRRVEQMFRDGLVEEMSSLLTHGPLSRTAAQALGYREAAKYLHGSRDLDETVELVQRHTRQLAKRQLTWFRSLEECRVISVNEPFDPTGIAETIRREGERIESGHE